MKIKVEDGETEMMRGRRMRKQEEQKDRKKEKKDSDTQGKRRRKWGCICNERRRWSMTRQ